MQLKHNTAFLIRAMLYSFCCWLLPVIAVHAAQQASARDIRVVIDLSGSMKQNDPHNHRTKAVQLFSEVLPADVRAGIWTFASDVNMLIKHGIVDKTWKDHAFKAATKIHSYGLHTNIEKALTVATDDWYKPDPKIERHLILLTDGYIDVSKDKNKNTASRNRVINKILPLLKTKGIIVHGIALSEHADHELLKKLSHKTLGNYKVINNASDLDRYFFKLFQTTTKPDTVPFKANRFKIDKAINDMTIVLFSTNYPTKIITPQKENWSFKHHPATVKWVKSDNYEVITVRNPIDGAWRVDAPLDPDNKVMVVTNLRLNVNKLPDLLMPGDKINIKAYLTDDHKIIEKESFIKLVSLKSVVKKKGAITRSIIKTHYAGKGSFLATLDSSRYENHNILTLTARGPTFTRQYEHEFSVVTNPVIFETKIINDERILIEAHIDDRVIDQDRLTLILDDHHSGKPLDPAAGKWILYLDNSYSGKNVTINIDSYFHNGKAFHKAIQLKLPIVNKKIVKHVVIEKKQKQPIQQSPVKPVTASKKMPAHPTEKNDGKAKSKASPGPAEEESGSFNWILVFIIVLVVNGAIIAAGYYIYRYFKKSGSDSMTLDESEVISTPAQNLDNDDSNLDEISGLEDIDTNITNSEESVIEDIDGLEDINEDETMTDDQNKPDVKSGEK